MRVLLFGTFDHLHPGHEFILREALKRGDVHVVIARDRNVERLKGKSPMQTESQRMAALQKAFPDVTAILGDAEDFLAPMRSLHPDLILLGYDQLFPPGVSEADFPCPVERLPAFRPEVFKSSLRKRAETAERS